MSQAHQALVYGPGNALTFPYAAGATVILHRDRATPQSITNLIAANGRHYSRRFNRRGLRATQTGSWVRYTIGRSAKLVVT